MADKKNVDEVKDKKTVAENKDEKKVVDKKDEQKVAEAKVEKPQDKTNKSPKKADADVKTKDKVKSDAVVEEQDDTVNSKKKIKSNKSMSKKKKGIIALVAALCVVAIVLSIVLPVVFYNRPRIFVKTADQFVAGDKVGGLDKYFYSLKKNISCNDLTIEGDNVYSIDMNKHSLIVNGEFAIKTSREGTLYIGTRKSDTEYTSQKASIKAKTIRIEAENMDVVIMADISCENLLVTGAKSLQIGSFLNGEDEIKQMEIVIKDTANVRFSGDIQGTATSNIDIYDANVSIDSGANITNTLRLFNSKLTVNKLATLAKVELDGTSSADVYGSVTNSIVGGMLVTMRDGYSCNTYQDVKTLVIYRDVKKTHFIMNCENVIYVEKLVQPVDINILEVDSKVLCNVTEVKHASGYRLLINDEEKETRMNEQWGESSKVFDITDYVKDIGTYKVSILPIGNFNDELDLTSLGHCTMYVDGDAISQNYNCVMTLQAPKNLRVNSDYIFEFSPVELADYYLIYVDGIMVVRDDITSTQEDLSRYVGVIGDHSVKVQAFSMNENIHTSSVAMHSFSTTIELEPVDNLTAQLNIGDRTTINLSWQGTANGYEYIVYLQVDKNPNRKYEVGRTSVIEETGELVYTIDFEELPEEWMVEYDTKKNTVFDVFVVAAEHDYYTRSEEASCNVKKPTVTSTSTQTSAR